MALVSSADRSQELTGSFIVYSRMLHFRQIRIRVFAAPTGRPGRRLLLVGAVIVELSADWSGWEAAMRRRVQAVAAAALSATDAAAQALPELAAKVAAEQGVPVSPVEVASLALVQGGTVRVLHRRRRMIECGAVQTSRGVSVWVRGGRRLIPHAFIARSARGMDVYVREAGAAKTLLRRRGARSWVAEPVRVLDAESVAQMLSLPAVREPLRRAVGEDLQQRLRRQLGRGA